MAQKMEGLVVGSYRLMEQIGMGGMATVYKAYQASMDRHIALKVLPAHYARDPQFVERFNREARTIARLEHKNILPVYDFGEDNGITYLAMRFLDGGTLKDVMAQGRLSLGDTLEIIKQVSSALDYAHRQGIVHRDIKPANIIIDGEGDAYLTDFGIAKILEGASDLTETGAAVGTPAYMAPEQSLGKGVDGRTDIYALGIILYELVVGRAPYQADTPMAVALKHIHEPLPIPSQVAPGIPDEIERVILKALAKEPEDRYQTASDFATALSDAVNASGAVDLKASTVKGLVEEARTLNMENIVPVDEAETALMLGRVPATQTHPSAETVQSKPEKKGLPRPLLIGGGVIGVIAAVLLILLVTGAFDSDMVGTNDPIEGADITIPEGFQAKGIYDDFENEQFEDRYDPFLWEVDENMGCDPGQVDGYLELDAFGNCVLGLTSPNDYVDRNGVGSMGVSFQIPPEAGEDNDATDVRIAFYTSDLGGEWATTCGLYGARGEGMSAYFHIYNTDAGYERDINLVQTELGIWYDLRMELNPDTMEFTCYLDDEPLGSIIPPEADQLREVTFYRSINAEGLAYVDNVTFDEVDVAVSGAGETGSEGSGNTATFDPSTLTLYDDFDSPEFEGGINDSLWVPESGADECQLIQEGGSAILRPSEEDVTYEVRSCGLLTKQGLALGWNEIGLLQTEAMLTAEHNGQRVTAGISIDNNAGWSFYCGIFADADYGNPIQAGGFLSDTRDGGAGYLDETRAINYDQWYLFTISVDPETMLISCFVDDALLYQYQPDVVTFEGDTFSRRVMASQHQNATGTLLFNAVAVSGE